MTNASFRVRVTGIDDMYSETDFTLRVEGAMTITNFQAKLNFAKGGTDSCKLKAMPRAGQCTNWLGTAITVDCGDAQVSWTLDKKGRGVSTNGTCRFSYNKRTDTCAFSANLRRGDWQSAWADYGMTNATIAKPGIGILGFPVVLTIGDDVFVGLTTLHYTAKAGKSGTAK
jgi:hypothetical protein